MVDTETNLHPKNNPSVNLKPNIVTGNIPDKAVTFKQLDQNLQNKIDSQSFQIAKNTADISSLRKKIDDEASTREDEDSRVREEVFEYADNIKSDLEEKISTNKTDIAKNTEDITKNTANIAKNTEDITKNTADITKNTADITNLESRTKNLEDTKVNVNTGTFDPTSDDPASQKSVYNMPIQFENIVDSHGNKRFVEGDINLTQPFSDLGITKLYGKWSLSGTHLMIVLAIKIPENITVPHDTYMCRIEFPDYITNKIIGLWGNVLDIKDFKVRNANRWYQNAKTLGDVSLSIYGGRILIGTSANVFTTEAQSTCRIQFDLLIDSE